MLDRRSGGIRVLPTRMERIGSENGAFQLLPHRREESFYWYDSPYEWWGVLAGILMERCNNTRGVVIQRSLLFIRGAEGEKGLMAQTEVVVLSGVRTAIGDYSGGLKDKPPTELGAAVVREAVKRAGNLTEEVGHVVFSNVIHTDAHDMYLARVAAINGGLSDETPALTLNRLCGSGLQAIVSAAQTISLGETKVAIGGGAEVMSRSQYWLPGARWGQRMGDGKVIDAMVGALSDPFDDCHMGMTAENIATKWSITRQAQDELAFQSHQRAAAAIQAGHFREQILPIESKVRGQAVIFDTDEHVKADTTLEKLAKLRPAFKGDGRVTAGNASGINDAAAAVVLMEASQAQQRGLHPLGRLVAYAHAVVEPKYMGIGPVPAVRKVRDAS